jgi:hypothetical protein
MKLEVIVDSIVNVHSVKSKLTISKPEFLQDVTGEAEREMQQLEMFLCKAAQLWLFTNKMDTRSMEAYLDFAFKQEVKNG